MTDGKSLVEYHRLPTELANMKSEADKFAAHSGERMYTTHMWERQTERLRKVSPNILVEDGGDTVRQGELSPGCRACKAGRWECLFLSMECNLSCAFCLTPCYVALHLEQVKGHTAEDLESICANLDIAGIGFSGGEPLLQLPRLLKELELFREKRPDLYLWVYTNGLPLTKEILSDLAKAGLNELRFNMAATDYSNSHATSMLGHAVACLSTVTVEIPAIPNHAVPLLEALPIWSRMGVKHLNLHELINEPGTPSGTIPGVREHCRMPDGHECAFNPHSANLAADVFRTKDSFRLSIAVNFCSLQNKARQLRGRRHRLAGKMLQPHEYLLESGEAESFCHFDATHFEFVLPTPYGNPPPPPEGFGIARARRLLPLVSGGASKWTHLEIIKEAEDV